MKSLLYQDAMVRAILREENPKRQTRRLAGLAEANEWPSQWERCELIQTGEHTGKFMFYHLTDFRVAICKPAFKPGETIYVRETWQWASHGGACAKVDDYPVWRATDPDWATMEGWRWRSPLHLSEADARLFLRIVSVRAERLQDISEEDARAEGVEPPGTEREIMDPSICRRCGGTGLYCSHSMAGASFDTDCDRCTTYRARFANLWSSIHGPESWEQNPFVWRYEFERVEKGAR